MMPRRVAGLVLVLATSSWGGPPQSDENVKSSLMYSCLESEFLSVSAATHRHDAFVDVRLRLTDPQGRTAGSGNQERPIPKIQLRQGAGDADAFHTEQGSGGGSVRSGRGQL